MTFSMFSGYCIARNSSSYVLILGLVILAVLQASQAKATKAFILHSYHQEYPWTSQEHQGLVNTLKEHSPGKDPAILTEYLDTKRVAFTDDYQAFFVEYLLKKYSGYRPDIIFVSDDNAMQFMLRYRDDLFPGIPVVFCGVNDLTIEEKITVSDVYGIFEQKDVLLNLHLIKKLLPETENVAFIGDDSLTYQAIYRQILASAATDLPDYNMTFLANKDLTQVVNLVKSSPDHVFVLTTIGGFHEEGSSSISIGTVIQRLRELGEFVIISMEDVYMRKGVLGGIVTSGRSQGKSAAETGMRILSDSLSPEERFIIGANIPTFDFTEMQRLQIRESKLPEGALLLNKPLSLFEKFKIVIFSVVAVFMFLCLLITFLLVALSRQKKAERELKTSRNFLDSVLNNLPDMVFVKSAQDLQLVRINKFGEQLIGEKAENIVGKTDYDFFPEEAAEFYLSKDREALATKKLIDIPVESISTPKGERYLHTKKIPLLDDDGNPVFLLGISRDITKERVAEKEKEELQDKLRQAQKMEAVGTLAGGIAHDFNNILGAIIGYTELAILQPDNPEQTRKYLDGTLKGAERARNLVRQILTFSRKREQQKQHILLADVVKESLDMIRSVIPSTIEIMPDIQETGHILADTTQVHQVVMNLCTNAYQAMQTTGGTLGVSLKETELFEDENQAIAGVTGGKYSQLTVSDSGAGMPPEVVERVFDPYFTTKGPEAGTGLGLAVVHGIIKSHGGFISVKSEPGLGTTVTVLLPLAVNQDVIKTPESRPGAEQNMDKTGARILVVDDEPAILEVTAKLLIENGHQVSAYSDGRDALKVFKDQKEHFDLIITDMTMPNFTGMELSKEILKIDPDASIILCTGFSSEIDKEKAKRIGIKGYCEKPVSLEQLITAVTSILDKK